MWILISTDLQLLTYIHIWNIDKNLSFNNSGAPPAREARAWAEPHS